MADNILSSEEIRSFFADYRHDLDRLHDYELKLFDRQDHEQWIAHYKERSEAIRQTYAHNLTAGQRFETLLSDSSQLTDELAATLMDELLTLDVSRYDDPFIACRFLKLLIDYYTPSGDPDILLPLYNRYGWETTARIRMGYHEEDSVPRSCYQFILTYRDRYADFTDSALRRLFFVAYHNLITALSTLTPPLVSFDEAAAYMQEAFEFYNSETVRSLDGQNTVITNLFRHTRGQWMALESNISSASNAALKYFCATAHEMYENAMQESGGNLYAVDADIIIADRHARVLENKCSYTDAIEFLVSYYDCRHERNAGKPVPDNFEIDDDYYFETRVPEAILDWLRLAEEQDCPCDEDFKDTAIRHVIAVKNQFFRELKTDSYSPFINSSLAEWCFRSLQYMEDLEDKEAAIFNNIINRQVATFFHSHMVEIMSGYFIDSLLENNPELLLPVVEAHSVEQLNDLSEHLCEYVRKAALLHDIGKNRITDIINMQTRRLTDEEFAVIKTHPRIGADSIDDDFVLYHDIILGHHRTYDCLGGYPLDFDPTGSKVKIIVDMIAICDSLDAATDYLGRNYATRKTFEAVVEELKAAAGTRYNPVLVSLLDTDRTLCSKLRSLIDSGREELYYELFSRYFMNT